MFNFQLKLLEVPAQPNKTSNISWKAEISPDSPLNSEKPRNKNPMKNNVLHPFKNK